MKHDLSLSTTYTNILSHETILGSTKNKFFFGMVKSRNHFLTECGSSISESKPQLIFTQNLAVAVAVVIIYKYTIPFE